MLGPTSNALHKSYVSVIIPCYNAAKTLPWTLKSLENQSYKDFEVIIINDGSSDKIHEVVDNYLNQSSLNIRYIEQSNSGVSVARNNGLKNANGKYICFLDGDDVYHRGFLELIVKSVENNNIDVSFAYFDRDIESVLNKKEVDNKTTSIINIADIMKTFMYEKENIHFGGFIYKMDIIDKYNISFTAGTKYGEDLEFAWKYLTHCSNGIIIKDKMYGYYNNPLSAVNTVSWNKTDLVEAMIRVKQYMLDENCDYVHNFSGYMLPRTVWTTAKTFAKGKRRDLFKKFATTYPVIKHMKKLAMGAPNRLLRISSALYCLNLWVFYYTIIVVYKNNNK
ncbi:MAG TPA: hypothetical protein DEF89_19225 [Desulfosporosinus sp.]|nr:hypothetical protein [Desulfosporosinus sp.]